MTVHLRLHLLSLLVILLLVGYSESKCSNPSVRREWRKLSSTDRANWIEGIKCLANLPHDSALTTTVDPSISLIPPINTSSSFWDDISYMHMDLNVLIHFTGFFLPWHRAYVWGVENAMKTKCNYKGAQPYWNWTMDAADFYHATIFSNNSKSGLGEWGDPNDDYQVPAGGLAKNFPLSYPAPHRLRRNFSVQPFLGPNSPPVADPALFINTTFTQNNTAYMLRSFDGDFVGFQAYFESLAGPHPGPHIILGGDMSGTCPNNTTPTTCIGGTKWSPNDPLFFMHHAMVDKLWYDWQHRNASNLNAFSGGSVQTLDNATLFAEYPTGGPPFLNSSSKIPNDGLLWNNFSIGDVMQTTSGPLCYIYD